MLYRLARDLLVSGLVSLCILCGAFVWLMDDQARGGNAGRPEYKVRTRESMVSAAQWVLSPVERPHKLVPNAIESIPVIGDASLRIAGAIAFAPIFWTFMVFAVIRMNQTLQVVTSEKLCQQFERSYGHLTRMWQKRAE